MSKQAESVAKTYRALSPIEHDGKRYEVDATIRLADQYAEPLLACGSLAPADDAGKK